MAEWATSGGIKIKRAKKHIDDLEAAIAAFQQRSPYGTITEDDPKAGQWVVLASIPEPPPLELGAIAGDAIHNLRSSLDLLIWQLVLANNALPTKENKFPFFPTEDHFLQGFHTKVAGLSQTAVDCVKATKPYKGGNDFLYELHRLDIVDKHHVLLPGVMAVDSKTSDTMAPFRLQYGRVYVALGGITPGLLTQRFDKPIYPVYDRTELDRFPINQEGPQMDMNPKFGFQIALGEGETVKGQPMVRTLNQFFEHVQGIVNSFVSAGVLPP